MFIISQTSAGQPTNTIRRSVEALQRKHQGMQHCLSACGQISGIGWEDNCSSLLSTSLCFYFRSVQSFYSNYEGASSSAPPTAPRKRPVLPPNTIMLSPTYITMEHEFLLLGYHNLPEAIFYTSFIIKSYFILILASQQAKWKGETR
ncbi:hypothetical protein niasHT_018360 [Heterodera trifolii]|uniref:Uncharacterized protein n=1 Tax=Heterodera trifolii TaxID=157864 RepID=A0ABD2LDE0_9BILA